MGKFQKGILGSFTGKEGNIIGSKWKGITYMRSLSDRSHIKPSERQIIQRARFAYASKFSHPLRPVIRIGYRTQSIKKSPYNAAMSHFMSHVLEGEYLDFTINYERLKLSKGSLVVGNNYTVNINGENLDFTWSDTAHPIDHGTCP